MEQLSVLSPFDGEVVGHLPQDDMASLEAKLEAGYRIARDVQQRMPLPERIRVLDAVAGLMRGRREELGLLIAREGGKPLTDALIEVDRAIDGVGLCVEHIRSDVGSRIPIGSNTMSAGRVAFTQKEPIGLVAAVSAFNHPLNLIVHQVAPAVASGCPVIVKPAPDTALSCAAFVDMLHEAGLPKSRGQILVTEALDVAEALVTDSRLAFFSFIGSANVGWMLKNKLAPGVRCALEHGGAAPAIVCDDADLDKAIPALVKGGFYHAGQVCVSVQRIFVANDLLDDFVERLTALVGTLKVGDPTLADTDVGPLIRTNEVTRVSEWVELAKQDGAVCAIGGHAISERLYAPTILVNPPADALVSTKEIFGPVVCVYGYLEVEEALSIANSLPVAFQAAVFTESIDVGLAMASKLDASAVMINDHTAFRDDVMPFAGLRQSGLGVGGIPHTIEDMQIDKMTVIKSDAIT